MARFDRAIPPGGEGKITLKVRTKGYQGTIHKSARVKTNDPNRKQFLLRIKGTVQVAVHVSPRHIQLRGKIDEPVTKVAEVRTELEKPLELTPHRFTLEGKVTYSIEEVEKGKRYRARFTSIPGDAAHYRGLLRLKTNYPEKPEITIFITGRFRGPTK
ncbi:MAG: hypothetical protein R6U38_13365 [Desulfatiglandaceae bacterium]